MIFSNLAIVNIAKERQQGRKLRRVRGASTYPIGAFGKPANSYRRKRTALARLRRRQGHAT